MAMTSLLLQEYWQHQKAAWTVCTACFGACSTYWANCSEHSQPWAQLYVGAWFLKPDTYSTDASPCYSLSGALLFLRSHLLQSFTQALSHSAVELPEDILIHVFSLEQPQNPCQSWSHSNCTSGSFPHLPRNVIILACCHKETDQYQF